MPAFTRYADPAMNTFKKSNMYYETDPFLRYQDPIYLGFKFFFIFDQPGSGLLSEQDHPNTALHYLINRGYDSKAECLIKFIQLFKKINQKTPWFFQSIEGLDEAWKHLYQEADFKPLLATDRKIIINCLDESVDMRMTALMDLYRKACFDWPNRREIVPLNLRQFKASVYVYEGRTFNKWGFPFSMSQYGEAAQAMVPAILKQGKNEMDKYFGPDPVDNSVIGNIISGAKDEGFKGALGGLMDKKADVINDSISRVLFNFEYCEFLPDESNGTVASLSNKEFGMKAQKIAFSYRNVSEDNIYRFHHDKKVTDFLVNTFDSLALDTPSLLQNVPDAAGPYINGAIAQGISQLQQVLTSSLNNLFLGNVYGFNAAGAVSALVNGGVSGAISLANEIGKNASKKNNTKDQENGFADNPLTTFESSSGDGVGRNSSLLNKDGSSKATSQGSSPENASLSNNSGIFGKAKYFDDFVPSLSNDEHLNPQPIGTNDSPDSVDVPPNGNYAPGSISLNNGIDVDPSGNYGTGSGSLNNDNPLPPQAIGTNDSPDSVDNAPNGNYGVDSGSLNNGIDVDPSGNVYE